VPARGGQRRVNEIAEAIAFFLALLAYLWWLAIPLPWSGVLVLLAVAASWRRRSLTPNSLGLGWDEFRASGRRWSVVWIFSVCLFLIVGNRRLFGFAALTHGAVYFAWAAAQQVVYQSMTCLPLRNNVKSRWLAAGLAGVAFSIMHVPNPILVPATYVWGVASSLLFERCRSVWGLALLQMMLASTLFWITPPELNRDFRIGPYYYQARSPQTPGRTFAPPVSIWIVSEGADTTGRARVHKVRVRRTQEEGRRSWSDDHMACYRRNHEGARIVRPSSRPNASLASARSNKLERPSPSPSGVVP
jgi:hypothetical protein